jgi:hypothetical protein
MRRKGSKNGLLTATQGRFFEMLLTIFLPCGWLHRSGERETSVYGIASHGE